MDDERYTRYLSSHKDGSSSDGKQSSHNKVLTAFEDAKAKLGLGRLSNTSTILLAVILVVLCMFGLWNYSPGFRNLFASAEADSTLALVRAGDGDEGSAQAEGISADDEASGGSDATDTIFVYVSGAVKQPDVYALLPDARAIDAINAAGGFLDSAASEALNLASALEDGMQIHVLTKKEFKEQGGNAASIGANQPSASANGAGNANTTSDGLVNLNTADSITLQTLPGVGPVTAEKIVKDREVNGPYSSLEDLMRVSGIGPKRVEALEGIASVGP